MFRGLVEGFVIALFWFATLLFLIIAPAFMFGPDLESRFYPVLKDVKISWVSYSNLPEEIRSKYDKGSNTWYALETEKIRACEPIKETFAWYLVNSNGTTERVNLYDTSEPLGVGRHKVYVYVENKDEHFNSQRFVVTHDCHPLWTTRTTLNIPVSSSNIR